jgi:uncharacterized 2Fe-2S/4Fe-4S cluster protein (DUF4445 family)
MKMEGISKKIYLELEAPTEDDSRSAQVRILDALKEKKLDAGMSLQVMRKLHPLCESADWKLTVSLAWNGENWKIVDLEAGDTSSAHYGLAVDLGSTTVVMRLINCNTGEILIETSSYNRQIAYGTDILTRIFYSKDNEEALEEIRKATVESFYDNFREIEAATGISSPQCIQMVVSGNTTMIHFLLGMDAFCVFHMPYAVRADRPGFILGRELEIPICGYLFCYPSKSNYLGGDIISGMVATELYKKEEICAFFDIGTNGELVLGNKEFLLCGAGAAGPALEGGVVKTGMRAASGAVDEVHIENGKFKLHVIGEGEPTGICGSGIVDMIAELFLNRWIDILGTLQPEKSELIQKREDSMAVEYAPGLFFYQEDISEFIKTKAAAYTMVEIMFTESGVPMEELSKFYVAGAFGKHVSTESAITIGMYPDIDRACFVNAGNASLEGAQKLLLHREILNEIDEILEKMVYIQYGNVERFLEIMTAAQALPHTDMDRYPTVKKHFGR